MPLFEYKGIDSSGKTIKGIIETDSSKSARSKIKKSGILLTSINEKSASGKSSNMGFSFGSKIKVQDMSLMTRQFASLVKANIPVVDALNALVDQTENDKLKLILSDVKQRVNEGTALAKALSNHPKAFSNIYINMVEAGEASGTLPLVLIKLADFTEAQVKLKNKIISALTYPVLMMGIGSLLLVAIFAFAIPKITKIFDAMQKTLPLQTKIMIGISDAIRNYWYVFIVVGFLAVFIFNRWKNTPSGRRKWDQFMLNAPVFGKLTRMISISRFTSTMGTLLSSGVPLVTSMNIVKNIVTNTIISEAIEVAREHVTEGQSLADPLKKSKQFPPIVIHMIKIGEKTGELPDMLENITTTYEEQIDSKIQGLTSLLEPAMIVGMGMTVAFIVMAVFVPLMELNKISR